jgi:hypothetical protein
MNTPIDPLLREVEEDLRRERFAALWKKFGGIAIAAVVAIVLAVAGYQGWQSYSMSARETASARFEQAQRRADLGPGEAAEAFGAIADDAPSGYALLARLREARARAAEGGAEALEPYDRLAQQAEEPLYRDLAAVLHALVRWDEGARDAPDAASASNADGAAQPMAEIDRLAAPDGAWRFTAREVAAAAAYERGDRARARELWQELREDPAAPPQLRDRMGKLLDQARDG